MNHKHSEKELEGFEIALKDEEVLKNLNKNKNHSAAGEDSMSYSILKGLNGNLQLKIVEMPSDVFLTDRIPDRWRLTEIKPIPKPGIDSTLPRKDLSR